MPSVTPSALANLAACFSSCVSPGAELGLTNYLLAQIWKANDAMADTTPAALMEGARCFNSCIPDGMQVAVMNYTLYQILAAGGGGGGPIAPEDLTQSGAGTPPLDGSWTKPFWRDTVTDIKYQNWGTVAAPEPRVY